MFDVKILNEEELRSLLVLRAGEIERSLRLYKMADFFIPDVFTREIHVEEKAFNDIVDILNIKTISYKPFKDNRPFGTMSFNMELYGKQYKIMAIWEFGKYGIYS